VIGIRSGIAAVCLAAPFVGLLWLPWYATDEPRLLGTPFFYWYQLTWIPASAALMAAAYRLTRPAASFPPGTANAPPNPAENPHPDQGGPA